MKTEIAMIHAGFQPASRPGVNVEVRRIVPFKVANPYSCKVSLSVVTSPIAVVQGGAVIVKGTQEIYCRCQRGLL